MLTPRPQQASWLSSILAAGALGVHATIATANPLNEFNLHEDPERGPHYHVTPGHFPHIIGGFWGVAEVQRPGAGGGPPPGRPMRYGQRRE
jgi:hypothetical protein